MKYSEITEFLNNNGIGVIQAIIAEEVTNQLETNIEETDFEKICETICNTYLEYDTEPIIKELVQNELSKRGLITA